jgi:hypothetical protein
VASKADASIIGLLQDSFGQLACFLQPSFGLIHDQFVLQASQSGFRKFGR